MKTRLNSARMFLLQMPAIRPRDQEYNADTLVLKHPIMTRQADGTKYFEFDQFKKWQFYLQGGILPHSDSSRALNSKNII